VTNLIEKIHFTLTLHRDEDSAFPYDNIMGLMDLPRHGHVRLGNLTYEWIRSGAEEVPEIGGGDN
jgi:hypothetical protein